MSIVGIAGPLGTGKSTLISLIQTELPVDTIIVKDIHDAVYSQIEISKDFRDWSEITKDRDYFLIYVNRVVNYFCEMVDAYKDYPELVIFDGTTYDLLIYSMLNLWYHYPTRGFQEEMVHKLLAYRDIFDVIYMTRANDFDFPLDKKTKRQYNTGFLKNRKTEIGYYDIFRELPKVVSLPSSTILECDKFLIDDLKSRNLI